MRIVVPDNLGSDLRLLPPDTYEGEIADLFIGESQTKQPKITIKYTLLSEYTGKREKDFQSCIGETVLDTFSLQPQAIWRLNDLYKAATGERLPASQEGFEKEEFEDMMKEALIGRRFSLLLDNEVVPTSGKEQTKVQEFTTIEIRKVKRSKK